MRSKDVTLFKRIIDYVNNYFENHGRSPSNREIEHGINVSRSTIQRYLKIMQEQGDIEYDGHRGIVTPYMKELMDTNRVQMGHSIPCGSLSEAIDAQLEHIRLPVALIGNGEFFLLRAKGNSMINAGIENGDLVLIRKQETDVDGRIVAFLYQNNYTTLKRYHKVNDTEVHLVPENDEMPPIIIKDEKLKELQVQGVAVKVIKDLK